MSNNEQFIKAVNTDSRSKNRLRFASSKQRAKTASANVYQSYKRRLGVTSASSREERVHYPHLQQPQDERAHKRQRKVYDDTTDRVAVLNTSINVEDNDSSDSEMEVTMESTFASELDLAHDRNASEIFSLFYQNVWHLVQSLPEVLHHATDVVQLCMSYLLSPESNPEEASPVKNDSTGERKSDEQVKTFIPNQATTDILHLLAVLARDLRHEIHPHLHSIIVPRIVYDLLNPPPPSNGKQPLPMSVTLVEAAFRTLSYIFKYDSESILQEDATLEKFRQYYGATLGHKRNHARRLAAETFAPLLRKIATESLRKKHIRRVLRALAVSCPNDSMSLSRAQLDAVDGVALLLFETCRGMPGRLHSRGHLVICCVLDCLVSNKSGGSVQALYEVTSLFMAKLCSHLNQESFSVVWKEIFKAANTCIKAINNDDEVDESTLSCILQLIHQVIGFKNGIYICKPEKIHMLPDYDECIKALIGLLKHLLEPNLYCLLPSKSQILVLQVLTASWRMLPDNAKFTARLGPLLPGILSLEPSDNDDQAVHPATILCQELLPYLPPESGVKLVGRAILSAAANQASKDPTRALMLLFSVASIRPMDDGDIVDDKDSIFFTDNAQCCSISSADKTKLINLCLVDKKTCCRNVESIAQLGVAVRCLPFLLLAGRSDDDTDNTHLLKRIWKWAIGIWERLEKAERRSVSSGKSDSFSVDDVVVKSLLLEACARMAVCIDDVDWVVVKKLLVQIRPCAEKFVLDHPLSIWVVKGVAAFVDALKRHDIHLNDSPNEIFEALIPNLRKSNHFLRLHTLEILASYPKKPFVTDHAEIDWTDDLDEEPSEVSQGLASKPTSGSVAPSGLCDVVETLLRLEHTPITFQNERQINACITRIEVLSTSSRIPVLYAEAASNHLLGILYVKFSPMWAAATRALVSLAATNDAALWEPLAARIKEVTEVVDAEDNTAPLSQGGSIMTAAEHHMQCMAWEITSGSDPGLFHDDVSAAQASGRVSRHLSTDESTVFGLVLGVLEGAPELTAKHSRIVVPIFLEFLHHQYFSYHGNDPDARELHLENEMEETAVLSFTDFRFGRGTLDKRLSAFLKVFAAVNGPQQLYKHQLLLSIFTCFLSSQDPSIAQSALACILKFKQPFVMPYADHLRGMLKRGQLRETMLNFDLSRDAKAVEPEHRAFLIPIITRIMFGRLSARASISKSSKETPAARRAAVLSFLSVLDGKEGELYPLFYLMVRSYIPKRHLLNPVEKQEWSEKEAIPGWIQVVKSNDLSHLREQRHEGFLNLLSAAITQFGHDIDAYVPSFMSIVLALCKYAEVGQESNLEEELVDVEQIEVADTEEWPRRQPTRKSALRTLCFRRLADLFDTFASSTDFVPFAEQMWGAVAGSVRELPVAAAYADKAPALLVLLKTLSTRGELIPLLSIHNDVVPSVIQCISDTSKQSVASAALDFVENLLSHDSLDDVNIQRDSVGVRLIEKHLSQLLHQFASRLGSSGEGESTPQKRGVNTRCTTRRELSILCRLSSLVVDRDGNAEDDQEVSQILCELLIPFLSPDHRSNEQDQNNVMWILSALIPKIGGQAAAYYSSLSRLFGPYKNQPGITSLPVRKSLSSVIETIAGASTRKELQPIAAATVQLCSLHSKRVDEIDYDKVLTVLNDLGAIDPDRGWGSFCGKRSSKEEVEPTILAPLVSLCFHFVYDDDGVVSRAAFKALKTLVSHAAGEASSDLGTHDVWAKLVENSIVSTCRNGLTSQNKSIRRLFVLLFAEVARCFKDFSSPNLYGDLSLLIRDDDPDLDFFLNITHVQIHRRSRALQRLRKMLLSDEDCPFSIQALSNFLLPLAMHPIYESKTKLEEALALDAVETVGAIAMHLSWSKYQCTLWTLLNQFERNPEQERYMIGAICAVIDSFHFDLEDTVRAGDDTLTKTAVWRALERRILPKTESLLIKEKTDRSGAKIKTLRPTVVLALSKLSQRFPVAFFETKLTRLLVVICGGLRSRDSDAREVARKTLAKMAVAIDVKYLDKVIRQLAVSLTEGYQLHVRMATLHTILQELSKNHEPTNFEQSEILPDVPFDNSIPAMMDLIQQDLFGAARERTEAEGAMKRLVKEASGSKSTDAIELICRMLTFVPSSAARVPNDASSLSSIHAVVNPLLERLQAPEATTRTVGRIGECLTRVVVGLSHNPTATSDEVLPFVYASIAPFVGQYESPRISGDGSEDDDEDDGKSIRISKSGRESSEMAHSAKRKNKRKSSKQTVVEWRPSMLNAANNALAAREGKAQERRELRRVRDGASAPKLTGSGRFSSSVKSSTQGLNNPAAVSAVTFGLGLLYSSLKKGNFDANDDRCRSMLDPFIPMLATCVCGCRNNDVVLLSLRCLGVLLRLKLPSADSFASVLGTKTLDILTSSGNLSNLNQELTQACFKALTLLIHLDALQTTELSAVESDNSMPLDDDQMQVLISLLAASVVESNHHHPTLGLIKAIVSRQFVSTEFYDLMDTMLDLSVKSHKATLRLQASKIFIQYLVSYPMGEARLEGHLKQVVLNVKFEYEEGRLSAIALITAIIEKLPVELLERHAQLFFLPLVLQFVNDESKECREKLSDCLSRLLGRAPTQVVQSFYDYTERWLLGTGPLKRTSLQLFGTFIDARPDFLGKGDTASVLVDRLYDNISNTNDEDEWEIQYFALLCLEKLSKSSFSALLDTRLNLWETVVGSLVHSHPWIKQVSSRMVGAQLGTLDLESFASNQELFLVQRPGLLYQVARNFCFHLNLDEAEQNEDLSASAIKSLVWIVQAMKLHPHLCYAETNDDSDEQSERNPVTWLMARLSNIAKPKGSKRREGIFKCFAAFVTVGGIDLVLPYLELILEPLHRSITESDKMMESIKNSSSKRKQLVEESTEATLAKDVLHLLEEACSDDSSEAFLKAYGAVETRAREKREHRKRQIATEAIVDPQASAERKAKKHEQEKQRRKRKVQSHRQNRGAKAKRRHM